MKKVVTFGEIMLRLAPKDHLRFVQASDFGLTFGGAEANVAVSLANYNIPAAFVTKLPEHEIGTAAVNSLRHYGVDTSKIVRGGNRVGIYFLEKGASQRASNVIYDRKGSSLQEAKRGDFDWDVIFDGAEWFHFTGITPALGDNVAEICLDACEVAKSKGVTMSCDLNYRKKLWDKKKACKVMSDLCRYVDICIANEEDAYDVFGIRSDSADINSGKLNKDGYRYVAKKLSDTFGFQKVAISLRTSASANDNKWAGMLYEAKDSRYFFSREHDIHIVDRVGSGDSFGSGIIYGCLNEMGCQDTVEFAVAASCLKHSIEGDFNLVTVDEVMKLVNGDGAGRVNR